MPYFLIAETHIPRGFLFALWRRDRSGSVTVLPWASRDRRDMQLLQRAIAELDSHDVDPVTHADIVVTGARRYAEGRPLSFVTLDEGERTTIASTIAQEIRRADDRPSGLLSAAQTEVFVLVGRHLVAMA